MPKQSKFEQQVDFLAEALIAKIKDDDLKEADMKMEVTCVGIAQQLAKDLHDLGEYVRSKKGREW